MKRFIFDVDGTLTPSRGLINPEFKLWFNNFCNENSVYLVTGSDKPKTIEQIGEDSYNLCETVFNCNGNSHWHGDQEGWQNDWILPEEPHEWLSHMLTKSSFPKRTGFHFDHRPGMVNFSIVGRNANKQERSQYVDFDTAHKERVFISNKFNNTFEGLTAMIGGETGIDISPDGFDKGQILNTFNDGDELHFFGDAMQKGGNDYPLARKILDRDNGFCYNIKNWETTWKILKTITQE